MEGGRIRTNSNFVTGGRHGGDTIRIRRPAWRGYD